MAKVVYQCKIDDVDAIQWTGSNVKEMRAWLEAISDEYVVESGSRFTARMLFIQRKKETLALKLYDWFVHADGDRVLRFENSEFKMLFEPKVG